MSPNWPQISCSKSTLNLDTPANVGAIGVGHHTQFVQYGGLDLGLHARRTNTLSIDPHSQLLVCFCFEF